MKSLFWLLMLFAAAVAVALGARLNDGYVLLVLPPYRTEISLNLFVVALLGLIVLLHLLLRSITAMMSLPARARRYRERRRRQAAVEAFQEAVRLLFEGRFGRALKKAEEAHEAGTAPGLSALIAARSAQRLRDPERQQAWIDRAKEDPRNSAATLMLEAEMMNEVRRFPDALAALDRLQDKKGRHIAALRLELRARQGTGDWDGVLRLARQLEKREVLPPEVVREIRTQAHLENIARRWADAGQLKDYLRTVPAAEQGRRVVLAAGRALADLGATAEAQKLVEQAIDGGSAGESQSELALLYGNLQGGDQTGRIAKAEHWLRQFPGDAGLLLALGRMCLKQRLWGKAQSYLEASLSVGETREAHLELAMLCDQLERADEANRHYRAGARLDGR
ncbi:MAG: heme biosynthesis HemY N-terminal domain-containing protein [Betaproteobacteria bacterium]